MMKKAPWGLIGLLVAVATVEQRIEKHSFDLVNGASLSWRLNRKAACEEAKTADILCLGDSLVKHGVQPRLIEAMTGQRVYNLSVAAAQPPAAFFLLRRALSAGAKPKTIVIDFAHDMLAGGPECSERNWPELADPRDAVELAITARDAHLFGTWLVGYALPSSRCRYEIGALVRARLAGITPTFPETNRLLLRNWSANLGAQLEAGRRRGSIELGVEDRRRLVAEQWWCHNVNRVYIRRFFQLASESGARVYWLVPPVSPVLQTSREMTGADQRHTRFVRAIQAEFRNLCVVDGRRSEYSAEEFVDAIHLNRRGAFALSRELGSIVNRPNGRRWLPVPMFREPGFAPPLEDIERSRLAILSEKGRVQ
jgi:hypothetical protein